jgi:hypothetical protein
MPARAKEKGNRIPNTAINRRITATLLQASTLPKGNWFRYNDLAPFIELFNGAKPPRPPNHGRLERMRDNQPCEEMHLWASLHLPS